jgi:parallel beta-helix repeat protein
MNRIFISIIIGILCLSIIWVLPSKVKAQQNLEAIVNGGFENGDLTSWTVIPGEGGGNVAIVTTNPHSGQYCACITGLPIVTQRFQGIPASSVQSITFCERTEESVQLGIVDLLYSDGVDRINGAITNSWSFFDVTSHLKTNKVLVGIGLPGWAMNTTDGLILKNTYYDDVSILYTPPPQQSFVVVSCSSNLVSIGQPVTCTATVTGSNPTGTITWSTSSSTGNFSQPVCTLSNGTCSTTYVDSDPGSVTIAACYSGDSNNAPNSGSTTLTVTSGPVYYSSNYTSVQAATDAAPLGSTVIVAPGFYTESLTLNKTLTIIGEKDPPVFGGGASGIYLTLLSGASGSIITGLEITNFNEGILVSNASNCRIYSNIMASMGSSGIVIEGSDATNNVIFDNIFQDTPTPINMTASADSNTIYSNIITSQAPVTLNVMADGNSVYGNSISASQILLNMTNSKDNLFYHNNFLSSLQIIAPAMGNNAWDNGYPSGGNYWNGYSSMDDKSGQGQNQPGSDGIGDTPYIVSNSDVDHYPLMKPWTVAVGHCVDVISVVAAKTVIGQGFSANMTVIVADNGEYAESFSVTAFANTTGVSTQQVNSLNAACQMVLTLAWSTEGLAKGNYTVSVCAWPVLGQTDLSGYNFTLGMVRVTVPGDVNGDFKVTLSDLVILATAYQSRPSQITWNANADIDGNGAVGLSDLVILAQQYGQHYP